MVYVFLADGFEEIEALCPIDLMRRAEIDVKTVSVNPDGTVTGAHGIAVKADLTVSQLSPDTDEPELIMLPGGMPGTLNLEKNDTVIRFIKNAADEKSKTIIAAICAAPSILGKLGLLSGRDAVCYPGFEKYLTGARVLPDKVAIDSSGKYITGAGMGAAMDFGLLIVEALCGRDTADTLKKVVIY